jgi:hypothetical protein
MSSKHVRDTFSDYLLANFPLEKSIDLTAEFRDLQELLAAYSIGRHEPWLGIQYIGSDEMPVTVPASNTQGKYRETGMILLHIVGVAKIGTGAEILTRAENFRSKLRGQRLGKVLIESVSPPNFEAGATLQFEGGFTSASITIVYEYDLDL